MADPGAYALDIYWTNTAHAGWFDLNRAEARSLPVYSEPQDATQDASAAAAAAAGDGTRALELLHLRRHPLRQFDRRPHEEEELSKARLRRVGSRPAWGPVC